MAHQWHFFRAGAVDQVTLNNGNDILALPELDQKLWVALAMPTTGVNIDPETLALLDADKDGRIRVQDILAAVAEIKTTFKSPTDVVTSRGEVKLSAIANDKVVAAAKRMLADLGKKEETSINVEDTIAVTKAFSTTVLNGDGIIIVESTDDAAVKTVIEDAIKCVGSVVDRSGKPGLDKALTDAFFADIDTHAAWLVAGKVAQVLGPETEAAADALRAVREKIEDFFTRCRLAAFDSRAQSALAGQEAELIALSTRTLSSSDEAIAKLPIARVEPVARLQMSAAINPAWAQAMATFADKAVKPILGAREALTLGDLAALVEKLAPFETWRSAKPVTKCATLTPERVTELADKGPRGKVHDLIAADAALTAEYDQITSVVRAVRYQRDFGRILRNFVNFSDFYSKRDSVFQAGTLYIDGRALHLCVPVTDAGKHGALAGSSDACLLYCEITREGDKKQIAAALTNGDADNVFVGRNGIFYDRDGKDWDATVIKVVSNPISVRQAFWSPYKKLVKAIEDTVSKRAQAADAAATAKMEDTGKALAHTDKRAHVAGHVAATGAAPPAVLAPAPEAPKKIDLGTVAAIGVAIGGVGTLVGALLAVMFGLGKWLPLGVLALLLMISGPAMLLAWLKLRRRNLGPILDANGWAINGRARINVSFGAAMTEMATIPKGAKRSLSDPFADKSPPWRLYIFLAVVLVLGGTWFVGRLDSYLPDGIRSTSVLGKYAPSYKAANATPPSGAGAAAAAVPTAAPPAATPPTP